ncbi:MAG: amidase [Actinomycetes bacterium]
MTQLTDEAGSLVPADLVETRTRDTYGAWMRRALEVAKDLCDNAQTSAADDPGWVASATTPDLRYTRYSGEPGAGADIAAGVDAGWLVARGTGDRSAAAGCLHGLTVAVKDIIDVAGLPTRNGTPGGLWREPTRSAASWQALEAAGARCVGKSATHEMAWGVTTPQVPHPADPRRSAGGSSGGSAACVAARISDAALGTDTGGSIRIPAALCGVVGFRPTTGSLHTSGVTALAPEQDVVGPLAADVRTAVAMLEVLLGQALTPRLTDPSGLRVGVLANPGRLDSAVGHAYRDTLRALAAAGVELVAIESSLWRQAGSISLLTMLLSSGREHAASVHAAPLSFGGEARALLTLGEQLDDDSTRALVARSRRVLAAQTAHLFAEYRLDACITPTTPCSAPLREVDTVTVGGKDEPVPAALTRFTAWASTVAMPAVSVPAVSVPAAGSGGELPVGVQIMAAPHDEHVCVHLALAVQDITRRTDHEQ